MGGNSSRSIARCKVSFLPRSSRSPYIWTFFPVGISLVPDPYPVDSGADTVLYARLLHL